MVRSSLHNIPKMSDFIALLALHTVWPLANRAREQMKRQSKLRMFVTRRSLLTGRVRNSAVHLNAGLRHCVLQFGLRIWYSPMNTQARRERPKTSRGAWPAFGAAGMMVCRSITFLLWFGASMMVMGASLAEDHPVAPASAAQTEGQGRPPAPKPKPAPAHPEELAAVFGKAVPGSIADLKSIEEQVKLLAKQLSPTVVAVEV